MKKNIFTVAIVAALFVSCNSGNQSAEKSKEENNTETVTGAEITYKKAENYFVKNDVTGTVPTKITSQEEFDNYFGMATTMGENGKPTAIDFSKEYVIVIDHIPTKNKTEIILSGIEKKGEDILVNYTINEGENAGFEMRPFLMLIVNKDTDGNVILNKQ